MCCSWQNWIFKRKFQEAGARPATGRRKFPVFKEFSDEARALRTETVLRHHAARHVTAGNSVELSGPSFPKRRTPAAPSRVGRRFASAAAAHSADLAAPQVAGTGASPAGTEVLLRPRPTLEAPGQNLLLHFSGSWGFSCVLEPATGGSGPRHGAPLPLLSL